MKCSLVNHSDDFDLYSEGDGELLEEPLVLLCSFSV